MSAHLQSEVSVLHWCPTLRSVAERSKTVSLHSTLPRRSREANVPKVDMHEKSRSARWHGAAAGFLGVASSARWCSASASASARSPTILHRILARSGVVGRVDPRAAELAVSPRARQPLPLRPPTTPPPPPPPSLPLLAGETFCPDPTSPRLVNAALVQRVPVWGGAAHTVPRYLLPLSASACLAATPPHDLANHPLQDHNHSSLQTPPNILSPTATMPSTAYEVAKVESKLLLAPPSQNEMLEARPSPHLSAV